ncbi:MAG: hypothetical protein M0Z77_10235 [Thermoplasmatales archaeon]|jgi:hypothetical protein|nr:hypothetical protein [Candidatus Thermoplasmatota archaeon]MDA8056004.1 hypothetical protein [Thermoplasmatales archaeon]
MRLFVFAMAIVLISMVPVGFVHGATSNHVYTPSTVNNATVINGMVQRAFGIIAGVSGLIIAILWVPIAIGYFSKDMDRKADAKERTKDALIGTVIFVMAVSGVLYAVVHYIVAG